MSRQFELLQEQDRQAELIIPERPLMAKQDFGDVRPSPPPLSPALSPETEWLRALEILRKHWRIAAIFAASVMAAVLLLTALTKPVYEPVARVEIDPLGDELFNLEGRGSGESSPEYLETQARNMQSTELLVTVIRQLHLDQVPEFKDKSLASQALGTA
jgi:uncharacterized protein involved in exopolysaccharide biosynthesis